MRRMKIVFGLAAGVALTAAGCATGAHTTGSGGGAGSTGAAPAGSATLTVRSVGSAKDVLVDSAGHPVYVSDQERDGMVRCMGQCASEWMPVTLAAGTTPHGGSGVTGTLATVSRSDGGTQLTYNGSPVYTFAEDTAGQVTGNGAHDSFGGTAFSWHVLTKAGAGPTPNQSTPSQSNNGGYGY